MKKRINIFWFRRDLRLHDNRGLTEALAGDAPVLPIFIFDHHILDKLSNKSDGRVQFIYDTVHQLKFELQQQNSDLLVTHGNPVNIFKKLIETYNLEKVYTNRDYEPYATERDAEVRKVLEKSGVEFISFKDQVIFEQNEIVKPNKKPYVMFTPYSKAWLKKITSHDLKEYQARFKNLVKTIKKSKMISLKSLGFNPSKIKIPNSDLKISVVKNYSKTRDYPFLDGTSHLGLHLRFGTVSLRSCVKSAIKLNKIWLKELIWREFFMQILWNFPEVIHSSFKKEYDQIIWRNNSKEFLAWKEGRTGYPLVDAGMRELNHTGYMHNRVRMVTASFLVKHLLIDWRWGEKYFSEKLLDFDLAANNGNWQWAAGCGCDAAPYFRIFNPTAQQEKFDPEYKYIKKWIPNFDPKNYLSPVVAHEFARHRALATYRKGLQK